MITLRDLLKIAPDADSCYAIRRFNLAQRSSGRPVSIKGLATELGFNVEICALPRGSSGRLVPDRSARNGFRIDVSNNIERRKQRWTVAHEIGHWLLHHRSDCYFGPVAMYRDTVLPFYTEDEQVEENEANQAASALFFDDGALEAVLVSSGWSYKKAAQSFGLYEAAVRIGVEQFRIRRR